MLSDNKKWVQLPVLLADKLAKIQPREIVNTIIENQKINFIIVDNELFAFSDYCPHSGASLSEGHCNIKGIITCSKHGYKFDTKTGKDIYGNGFHLKKYKVEQKENAFYVLL